MTKANIVHSLRVIKSHMTSPNRLWVGGCCLIGQVCQEQSALMEEIEEVVGQDLRVKQQDLAAPLTAPEEISRERLR